MNISFLNPSMLWVLPLAAIPIVVHLFFKKRPARVDFSDLRFIRLALEKVRAGHKLRQYLLLILRTLILIMLILFFARPLLQRGNISEKGGGNKAQSFIFLFDVSYSMGYIDAGKQRLENYKDAAKKMIKLLPAGSKAAVGTYSNRIELTAFGNDRNHTRDAVDAVKLSYRSTDIGACMPAVNELCAQLPDSDTILILLTDLASHGFKNPVSNFPSLVKEGRIYRLLAFKPSDSENIAVKNTDVTYDDTAEQWVLDCSFESYRMPPAPWPVTFYSGNKKAASDLLSPKGKGQLRRKFVYSQSSNEIYGRIEAANDHLQADDIYYFYSKRPAQYKIWIIDGDTKSGGVTSESFYLSRALSGAEACPESEAASINFSLPGVVILANVREEIPSVERFISEGGGALIFTGDHYSETFQPPYLPASFGSLLEQNQGIKWNDENNSALSEIPISQFDWSAAAAQKVFVLKPEKDTQVLASLSSGWPYLVEGSYGKGKVVLCASTADRDWNNLAARPLYAPLTRALARHLSSIVNPESVLSYHIGDIFRHASASGAHILTPNGKSIKAAVSGTNIIFDSLDEPGIYRLMSNDTEITKFTVNTDVNSRESDLTPITAGELKEYFKSSSVMLMPDKNWEKHFISFVSGTDITRNIIVIIILLLLAEFMILKRRVPR